MTVLTTRDQDAMEQVGPASDPNPDNIRPTFGPAVTKPSDRIDTDNLANVFKYIADGLGSGDF